MEQLKLQKFQSNEYQKTNLSCNPLTPIDNAISAIFSENSDDYKFINFKHKLGDKAEHFTDEQIQTMMTDFQYLIDCWLNEFEKDIFDDKTLLELLGEQAYANTEQRTNY